MREAVIVSAVRTRLGAFSGALGNIGATDLGGMVIAEAVKRAAAAKSDPRRSAEYPLLSETISRTHRKAALCTNPPRWGILSPNRKLIQKGNCL